MVVPNSNEGDRWREAALAYARRGWAVLPLYEIDPEGHCSCGQGSCRSPGKHPRTRRGVDDATTNEAQIRKWFAQWPHANLGVRTGSESGLIVLDVDPRHGGDKSLDALTERHGLPETTTARTGGGGQHIFFSFPEGDEIGNHANLKPGLDLRGERGYVVLPPSNHASGRAYEWDGSHPLAEVPDWLTELIASRQRTTESESTPEANELSEPLMRAIQADSDLQARFNRVPGDHVDHSESGIDASLACLLVRRLGLSARQVEGVLRSSHATASVEPKRDDYYSRTAAAAAARVGATEGQQASKGHLPEIILTHRHLADVVADVVQAVQAANYPERFFLRAGMVTLVGLDEAGCAVAESLSRPGSVLELLAGVARYFRVREGIEYPAFPAQSLATVVEACLARTSGLPPLTGIVRTPMMRPTGEILSQPGYDAETRTYYAPVPGFKLPPVPSEPAPHEIEQAVGVIVDVVRDFPFVDEASQAAAIAVLITPLIPEVIGGLYPLVLVDSPSAGTGKGLLTDVISLVATGTLGPKMPEPGERDDAEWRKRLTAALLDGGRILIIDNVERPLSSPSLAAALTAAIWRDRILGSSRIVTVPNEALWIATGNNLRLRGDLPRRAIWCRMDAKLARPWTRKRSSFRHPNLAAYVLERRSLIIAAVFTLVRAWIAAGRIGPYDSTPALGSYEQWRDIVGGVLRVAEIPGFLENQESLYAESDSGPDAWAEFVEALHGAYGDAPFMVAQVTKRLSEEGESQLRDSIPPELAGDLKALGFSRRLGHALAKKQEVRFERPGGLGTIRVTRAGEHNNATRWRVMSEP